MNHKTYHPVFGSDAAQYNMAENFRQAFPEQRQDYNERHFVSLQFWAVIFFVVVFGTLLIAGSNGWIK